MGKDIIKTDQVTVTEMDDDDLAAILGEDPKEAIDPGYDEPAVPRMSKYISKVNPGDYEVNVMLDLGYKLHSVSTKTQEFIRRDGYHISLETSLVYHFVLEG